ncbi:MAG TPA: hypothetical protein VFK13_08230 [Gemmatimonadaceae bacterium]|nr:hypothetical protein [Gemmatimonadaceae bacterium]
MAVRACVAATFIVLAAACASGHPATRATPEVSAAAQAAGDGRPASCVLLAPPEHGADTIVVGLSATIDPAHAPVPTTDAERLLFGWLYEPLVRADCTGAPAPAVVARWERSPSGNALALTVSDSATFWNGDPVTADGVVDGWRDADAAFPMAAIRDARTIEIPVLGNERATLLALAWPRQSVRRGAWGRWPGGTGAYAPDTVTDGTTMRLLPRAGGPVIVLRTMAGRDVRDLLDAGADLVVTDDRAAITYAEARRDLDAVPLPWERSYVLLVHAPGAPPDTVVPVDTSMSGRDARAGGDSAALAALRASLAGDVVRVDARAAEPPYWWDDVLGCAASVIDRVGATAVRARYSFASETRRVARSERAPASRIAVDRDDPVARALAERLVALASFGARSGADSARAAALPSALREAGAPLTVAPLAGGELSTSMAHGDALAYVVALPRRALAPCDARRRFAADAPWLGLSLNGVGGLAPSGSAASESRARGDIVPLIDVRQRAIVRRGVVGLAAGWGRTLDLLTAR